MSRLMPLITRARMLPALGLFLAMILAASGCEKLDELIDLRNSSTEKITRTTVPPEMQADANSSMPVSSADGRFVAFKSDASNLVIATTNGATGIFVKDVESGKTLRVSTSSEDIQGNKDSGNPAISLDGRFVAFDSSSSNLTPGDTNENCTLASGASFNCVDVFIKDTENGRTMMVSTNQSGVQGNRESSEPSVSADGRFVAFKSAASDLAPGDSNGRTDIFVKDTLTGAVQRVSTDAAGSESDDDSTHASISADGRFVAFSSSASNLVPDDTNGKPDVFIKDILTGAITRASTGSAGEQSNDASGVTGLALAADGGFIAFESAATNLVDGDANGKLDIFVKDLKSGAVVRASVDGAGGEGLEDSYGSMSISREGRTVAFRSDAPNLVPGDTNIKSDTFIKNLNAGTIFRVSTNQAGGQGSGASEHVSVSADGRWAAFDSSAPNLLDGDSNNKMDIFLKDIQSGAVKRISTGTSDVL